MSWYICNVCGHLFEDGEEAHIKEQLDVIDGQPVYENRTGCPMCGGDYEEAVECAVCGGHFHVYDLSFGVCDECYETALSDKNILYDFALGDPEGFAEFLIERVKHD